MGGRGGEREEGQRVTVMRRKLWRGVCEGKGAVKFSVRFYWGLRLRIGVL